jgi:SAM-dependent methyltransferase
VRWRRTKNAGGRLPSLGQDFTEGHRRYVERLGPAAERWLRTKPFAAPPDHELVECLRTFAHVVDHLGLGFRDQVLDVGCGPGWLSEFLARCGYAVTGVDVSEDMVAIARQRVAAINEPVGADVDAIAEFHAMPAVDLPWSARFDAAILYDAMHHLDSEVETLKAIRRALVPGGRIFIHEGVRPETGSAGEQFLIEEMERYGTLESPFDSEYLVATITEAGFTDVTRLAAVDELLDVSSAKEELQRVAAQLEHPPMNTVVAVNPIPAELSESAFAARIVSAGTWSDSPDGRHVVLPVEITNVGRSYWPNELGNSIHSHGVVTLGPHFVADGGRIELPRSVLPHGLSAGESVGTELRVPRDSLSGRSELSVDLVREGIAWFADPGSASLTISLPLAS